MTAAAVVGLARSLAPDEARVYTRRLLDRFRALPGVEAVGAISNPHLNPLSQRTIDFNVDGSEPPTDHGAFIADRVEVEPGLFEAAGIEIAEARRRRWPRRASGAVSPLRRARRDVGKHPPARDPV